MSYWLLKSEPEHDYGYDDLERDGETVWNGVKNNLALKHMRQVRRGDQVLVYHTGKAKAAVGIAEVTRSAYPDPGADDERIVAFDIRALRRLERPVTLAVVKADEAFADFLLVRMSRLSVMPVSPAHWKRILRLAGSG
jgi:predicted RNA-binding protein with PUA-like domain